MSVLELWVAKGNGQEVNHENHIVLKRASPPISGISLENCVQGGLSLRAEPGPKRTMDKGALSREPGHWGWLSSGKENVGVCYVCPFVNVAAKDCPCAILFLFLKLLIGGIAQDDLGSQCNS